MEWYANPGARAWRCEPIGEEVVQFHESLDTYAPTPLTEVPTVAAELGVGRAFVKDESARLGLPAFKALGAFWAIHRALRAPRETGTAPTVELVAATDGNHGRAVARMAKLRGLRARIFVPAILNPRAIEAIAGEGAVVVKVDGGYDRAVEQAAEAAEAPGVLLIQDMGWPGYEEIPRWIVEGYSTLFVEADRQLARSGARPAALVVMPVGVGSLAQAAVTHYRSRPEPGPALLSVEPERAGCLLASLRRGALGSIPTSDTIMAGLNCGTPSALAWPVLRAGLDAATLVGEEAAASAVRDLAALAISSGPCGAAALAGARAALTGTGADERRAVLGVGRDSTVVLLSTESSATYLGTTS